jgi:hypothetical protein
MQVGNQLGGKRHFGVVFPQIALAKTDNLLMFQAMITSSIRRKSRCDHTPTTAGSP